MSLFKKLLSGSKNNQDFKRSKFKSIKSVLDDLKPKYTEVNQDYVFRYYERELTRFYAEGKQLIKLSHLQFGRIKKDYKYFGSCLLYTSPSPRDRG